LAFLVQSAKTSTPIEEAVNFLSWVYQLAVVEDPTDHPLVKQVLAGAKRIRAHKTTKKEPITPEILNKMFDEFVTTSAQRQIIHTMSICLLGYAGFL
jgi:tRNA uridine 5-carbamoylmethylation protein Kti12